MHDNPIVTVAAIVFIWLAIVLFTVEFIVCVTNVPTSKVNATCLRHRGVASVSDHVWGVLEGGATVVCKDGIAFKLD